jgi:hypothetical protein
MIMRLACGLGRMNPAIGLWFGQDDHAIGLWFGQDESCPKPQASGENQVGFCPSSLPLWLSTAHAVPNDKDRRPHQKNTQPDPKTSWVRMLIHKPVRGFHN